MKRKTPNTNCNGIEGLQNQTTKPILQTNYTSTYMLAGWDFSSIPVARIQFPSGRIGLIPIADLLLCCPTVINGLSGPDLNEVLETAVSLAAFEVAA